MDPVTAFSLAAGVLQVVELSLKALSTCKEFYNDDSLAQHRNTEALTKDLAETTERLEKSVSLAPTPVTSEAKAVIDVSRKCSETAAELHSELTKLRLDPGGGLRQSIEKSWRSMRRKTFITDTQEKLDKYQKVLNTRILSKLDVHAVQQIEELQTLDHSVKDLAFALSQGCNTVTQLIDDQTVVIQQHIDRRFEQQAHSEALQKAQQQFKDSLFYPEIFARQDDIPKSHEGTCRWIFGAHKAESGNDSGRENEDGFESQREHDFESKRESESGAESLTGSAGRQPWFDFADWYENGQEPYWLSGKPGSGKSTLMKYTSTEFREYCQSKAALPHWTNGKDLVTCSFFFWNMGSPLQKNYVGFLRSLLYQIGEQRDDLVPTMISEDALLKASCSMYTWTKERLDGTLRRFLAKKPPSISLCMFIDGLDEFSGDEDSLMDTIRLLSRTSRTKVCVSRRPEQIFRQGFANSPQLRLQDLNKGDIQHATSEQLGPALEKHFPQLKIEIDSLVHEVTYRSQGIFLWANLIIKDLKRGLYNADNMQELRERLDNMPDTVQGVYEHMLNRLDKHYVREATKYFHFLLAYQDSVSDWGGYHTTPTLLHFACVEETVREYDLNKDRTRFESFEFHESCSNLETRILTRCAGLVEIDDSQKTYVEARILARCAGLVETGDSGKTYVEELIDKSGNEVRISLKEENFSRYLRDVRFIHKTVMEFLQSHMEFFQDPDWRLQAHLAAIRSNIRVASLAPIAIPEGIIHRIQDFKLEISFVGYIVHWIRLLPTGPTTMQLVDQMYVVWNYIYTSLNGPEHTHHEPTVYESTYVRYYSPFHNSLGFAAFFGCYDYVALHIAMNMFSQQEMDYLLSCTVLGIDALADPLTYLSHNDSLEVFIALCNIVLKLLPHSSDANMYMETDGLHDVIDRCSPWSMFIHASFIFHHQWPRSREGKFVLTERFLRSLIIWKDTVASFLSRGADVNTVILHDYVLQQSNPAFENFISIGIEETALSHVRRNFITLNSSFGKEFEDLLKSYNGLDRSSVPYIGVKVVGKRSVYHRLTQEQSKRFLQSERLLQGSLWQNNHFLCGNRSNRPDEVMGPWPVEPTAEAEELLVELLALFEEQSHALPSIEG